MESLAGVTKFNEDYSGQNLRDADLSHSKFICCKFDDADLSGANASHSEFIAGSMKRTRCTNTNFAHTRLNTYFYPSDCYGMTLTLQCQTFNGMKISSTWWYGWLFFALMMTPETEKGIDPRDGIISAIGTVRYLALKRLFKTRVI